MIQKFGNRDSEIRYLMFNAFGFANHAISEILRRGPGQSARVFRHLGVRAYGAMRSEIRLGALCRRDRLSL